jgi:purine-binding chemotaxis protein CheW
VAASGDTHPASERQLIVFSLHGERYGLPIGCVKEIIRYTPPRVTAAASGLIQGMINLRGRIVPVIDLSSRLGAVMEISTATRILVLEVSRGVLGLIVDGVDGVQHVPIDRIEPIPGAVAADALGVEIAAVDDQLIMLVEPERALGQVLPVSAPEARPRHSGQASGSPGPPPSRPPGPPPPRRRSAATPQVPRSRRGSSRRPPAGEE